MSNTYVVIMAGGSGTRFWPFSRVKKPKQFLDVLGLGKSLLQMTFERFRAITDADKIFIVSNKKYKSLIAKQLPELSMEQILLEPFQRNTAPCIAYASYKIGKKDPNATIIVSPADHVVFKDEIFTSLIKKAANAAKSSERIVTVGVEPNRPETGYGYIQYMEDDSTDIKKVKTFTEKPELEIARTFVESGEFVWNAGIFVFSVSSIKTAFGQFLPDMAESFDSIEEHLYTAKEQEAVDECYTQCKSISIDYGIMEKAKNVFVVLGDFGWSDLGSWDTLYESSEKDENDNVIRGNAMVYDSNNCTIIGRKKKLLVVCGVDDLLVAHHGNAVLVASKDCKTSLRQIVHDIQAQNKSEYL
ncbi:MAG: mannose-1-phosphate guanylyltransferase [Bacteroidota bacterium]